MSGSIGRVLAIASNTLRESLRNRVVFGLLCAALLFMGASLVLGFVSPEPEDRARVIINFNLTVMTVLSTFAAIFLGTSLIYQEIERRTVYTLLARPLSRGEFIAGKYLGLIAVNFVNLAALGLLLLAFLLLNGLPIGAQLPCAILALGLELIVVTGIALLLSVSAHPIEGALFALVIAGVGHSTASLKDLGAEMLKRAGDAPGFATRLGVWSFDALYYILPNLDNFNLRLAVANELPVDGSFALLLVLDLLYALVYGAILLTLACLSFQRRQL